MTTPGLPVPPRPCRVCAAPTTLIGGRCEQHTRQRRQKHNEDRAFYHSTEWTRLRAACLDRDHQRCVVCTGTTRLTAHHIRDRRSGGKDELDNLVTLCQSHHSRLEAGDQATVDLLAEHLRHTR